MVVLTVEVMAEIKESTCEEPAGGADAIMNSDCTASLDRKDFDVGSGQGALTGLTNNACSSELRRDTESIGDSLWLDRTILHTDTNGDDTRCSSPSLDGDSDNTFSLDGNNVLITLDSSFCSSVSPRVSHDDAGDDEEVNGLLGRFSDHLLSPGLDTIASRTGHKQLVLSQSLPVRRLIESLNSDCDSLSLYSPVSWDRINMDEDVSSLEDDEVFVDDEANPKFVSDGRFRLMYTLLKTEKEYNSSLKNISEAYAEPLRKYSSLTRDEHKSLFRNVEPLMSLSAMLCLKLEHVLESWDPETSKIGCIFSKNFWLNYTEYLGAFENIKSYLKTRTETHVEFKEFCNVQRRNIGKSLEFLLALPIQRIADYESYLDELLRVTDDGHPDFEDLVKAASKVKNMISQHQGSLSRVQNESSVERVQGLFPHDDLQLSTSSRDGLMKAFEKSKVLSRRKSAPSALLFKSLSQKPKSQSSPHIGSGYTSFSIGGDSGTNRQNVNRLYIMEGHVQLATGLQSQPRYLFLFNDLLLIAKQKSTTTFKLKHRVRLGEMWTSACIDEVSEVPQNADTSFVMGWPTTNVVTSFATPELKEQWLTKLNDQIQKERSKEEPKTLQLKVLNKDTNDLAISKSFPIANTDVANEVVKMCMDQFEITEGKSTDYQLWVRSSKEDSPYPLIGHELPFSIKMSHVRDRMGIEGTNSIPEHIDFSSEESNSEHKCDFILRQTKKPPKKLSLDEQLSKKKSKKNKKSPIMNLFKRAASVKHGRSSSSPLTSPASEGILFCHSLEDVSVDNEIPRILLDILRRLFHDAPFTNGIFRKSANARVCKELRFKLDSSVDCGVDDVHTLVLGATFKEYLRSLPTSLLDCNLYESWVQTNATTDKTERINKIKQLLDKLPRVNVQLLEYFVCVLYHVDKRNEENQMNSYNLAVCVAHSVLWPPLCAGPRVQTEYSKHVIDLVQFVLENAVDVFNPSVLELFGPPSDHKTRQDSSTDSDSMHSMLSMHDSATSMGRRDTSSLDSLERDCHYHSEMELDQDSPRLRKAHHLSPSNLSRDSGLTLSDTQLYNEEESSELSTDSKADRHRNVSRTTSNFDIGNPRVEVPPKSLSVDPPPVAPPRYKRRNNDVSTGDSLRHPSYRMAITGITTHNHNQSVHYDPRSVYSYSSSDMHKLRKPYSKRISTESLESVDEYEAENRACFRSMNQRKNIERGTIQKSASGAHLFVDEDVFNNHHGGHNARLRERRVRRQSSRDGTPPTTPTSPLSYSSVDSLRTRSTSPSSPSYQRTRHNKGPAPVPPAQQYESSQHAEQPTEMLSQADAHDTFHRNTTKSAPENDEQQANQTRVGLLAAPESVSIQNQRASIVSISSKSSAESVRSSSPASSVTLTPENRSSFRDVADTPPPRPPKSAQLKLSCTIATSGSMDSKLFYDPGIGSPPPNVLLRQRINATRGRSQKTRSHFYLPGEGPSHPIRQQGSQGTIHVRRSRSAGSDLESSRPAKTRHVGPDAVSSPVKLRPKVAEEDVRRASLASNGDSPNRPNNPPCYKEAMHRKSLIESGQPVPETEIVKQSMISAKARELYEKSMQMYEQRINVERDPSSERPKTLPLHEGTGYEADSEKSPRVERSQSHNLEQNKGNSTNLQRSKSDSSEHLNKNNRLKHLTPVHVSTKSPSPDKPISPQHPSTREYRTEVSMFYRPTDKSTRLGSAKKPSNKNDNFGWSVSNLKQTYDKEQNNNTHFKTDQFYQPHSQPPTYQNMQRREDRGTSEPPPYRPPPSFRAHSEERPNGRVVTCLEFPFPHPNGALPTSRFMSAKTVHPVKTFEGRNGISVHQTNNNGANSQSNNSRTDISYV